MAIREKLRIDDRFSWSFTGVILAVLFGAIGLYSLLRENRPNLVCEIQNQSDVLDLHRPLKDLALEFRGQDIQQQNLNLRIYTVRVSNKGRVDILQSYYDQDTPWGITVKPGQIIEARLTSSNSSYLTSRIGPEVSDPNTITLRKVIFEHDRYATLDILVLHHKESPPRIGSFGKIAGIDEIPVIDISAQQGRPGFWSQVLSGSPLVQITRIAVHLFGLIMMIIAAVGLSIVVGSIGERRRRRRFSSAIARLTKGFDEDVVEIAKDLYAMSGVEGLLKLQALLKNENMLRRVIARSQRLEISPKGERADAPEDLELAILEARDRLTRVEYGVMGAPLLSRVVKKGLVKLSPEGKIDVNPTLNEILDELTRILK